MLLKVVKANKWGKMVKEKSLSQDEPDSKAVGSTPAEQPIKEADKGQDAAASKDGEKQQQDMEYPVRSGNVVQDDIGHLQHKPRHDDVGNRYLEDITTF